jgi:Tol biopolymer transport system component
MTRRKARFTARISLAAALAFAAHAQQNGYPVVYPAATQGGQYMHNYYLPPSPISTPWHPAWSPDGKSIAFSMQGSVWKVDLASGVAAELTHSPKYHGSPDWSPDGKWIVYTADDDTRSINLEILNVATGETRTLTTGTDVYLDPVFSPDGKWLAYVSTRPAGYFNIYMRPIKDGAWAGGEVALTKDNRYPRDRLYFGPWDFHITPAWTPDSKELLFVSNRNVALGSGDIWRMPARANGMQEGVKVHAEQTLYRTRPHVSPDGKRFIYSSTSGTADQYQNIYTLPVAGGQPYKLTFGQFDSFHPRFSPDGETIAYISNEAGVPWLWLLETYGGGRTKVEFKAIRWKRPMGKLRIATGTPVRVHLQASDGKFYAPMDAYARRGRTSIPSFHARGNEEFDVPAGRAVVTLTKGFGRKPVTRELTIAAGQTATLSAQFESLDFAQPGWYSASTHVHMNYGGNLHNTPANLLHMARAEGMDLVMNQVANKDNRILDYHYFEGAGEHSASRGLSDVKLHFGQEYRPPFYGHVFYLGLRDHLISPFTTGYEGTGIESLYPSNTDMFRKARAQGAATGYVHAFYGDADPLEGNLGIAKGYGVDVGLRSFDALEWSGANRATVMVIHHSWNNDFRVAPVGGEDSISSLHWTKLVGSVRTYAYSKSLDVAGWLDALRKGHTYMSTGPLLRFTIDGKLPGEEIRLPAGGGTVNIEAAAACISPLSKIVIHRNGQVFREVPASGLKESVRVTESGWYSLYAEGPEYKWLDAEYPQAITNAIRVYVGGQPIRNRASAEYFDRWVVKLRGMAEEWPWWRSQKEKDHVYAQFEEARRVHQKHASEAK